jgi:hypothetical protein
MNKKVLRIPYAAVNEDWSFLQQYLNLIGNPRYIIIGDVDLNYKEDILDLGNLVGVIGFLDLGDSSIESLGELEFVERHLFLYGCNNIKTIGKLKRVGGDLDLDYSSIESLGNLEFVGEDLWIRNTKIPKSDVDKVNVGNEIIS